MKIQDRCNRNISALFRRNQKHLECISLVHVLSIGNQIDLHHNFVKNSRTREIKINTVYHGDYTVLIADIFFILIFIQMH